MSNETIFFIFGIALAVSAVLVSLAGLKLKDFPGRAMPVVVLWFAILVGGATTFAVLHAKDEDEAKGAEFQQAGKEIEKAESSGPFEAGGEGTEGAENTGKEAGGKAEAKGPGGTIELAAEPGAIAYDTTTLSSNPGEVTIDFENPSPIEHDVAIEQNGKEIAASETIDEGKTSVSANLAPGTYTFFCTVPGHREAGMEGTLTVK
ncbi:MAG TPA: plastocyanin/azurin family copper-binding protein [Solirubrobacterales bacterium]|jgi:plastocyanin|nr:plastocyanin/azurin family copper-binding protein [Solirubrobacterales bacterium]